MTEAYLIIDSSSASIRAGVVSLSGEILSLCSRPIANRRDKGYEDALWFSPSALINDLLAVCRLAVEQAGNVSILAVSAASQREGVVLLDEDGRGIMGLPNIDNRGLAYEKTVEDRHGCYMKAGRWVSTLFPAVKLMALRDRQPEVYGRIRKFTSISDYIGYSLTGVLVYEMSQACETLLLDVRKGVWDEELCGNFGIPMRFLPRLAVSGERLGSIRDDVCEAIGLRGETPFYIGGADTQLAVESCLPGPGDMVIVAGTTTPIISVHSEYRSDDMERCWSNRHTKPGRFIVETNVGVSGINYDRAKDIFYPNTGYEDMERELGGCNGLQCMAAVGSMCFETGKITPYGGFMLRTPLSEELNRRDFVYAVLCDYAYSFKENFDNNVLITGTEPQNIYGCGNGFAGGLLPQMMADLIGRDIHVVKGFSHATITGTYQTLHRSLTGREGERGVLRTVKFKNNSELTEGYALWKKIRRLFNSCDRYAAQERLA